MRRGLRISLHATLCLIAFTLLCPDTPDASGTASGGGGRKVSAAEMPRPDLPSNRKFLGVYDIWWDFFAEKQMDVEEQYVDWSQSEQLDVFFARVIPKRRLPLVTIEPRTTASGNMSQLLLETATGKNDAII